MANKHKSKRTQSTICAREPYFNSKGRQGWHYIKDVEGGEEWVYFTDGRRMQTKIVTEILNPYNIKYK